jgi:hypothetical protein
MYLQTVLQIGSALKAALYAWGPFSALTVLRPVHITRARRETRLMFTCARKSSSTLLQLLARLRRVRILIFTRSVYRL